MEIQFAALDLAVERVEALLPVDVPAKLSNAARLPDGSLRLGLGEIACTLSHFTAWQRALDRGAAACAVLEDDAIIARELPTFLRQLGTALPSGVDLLKLETWRVPVRLGRRGVRIGDFAAQELTSTHFGTCGYVISAELARRLIESMPITSLPIDHFAFARRGQLLYTRRVYQLIPALTVQLAQLPLQQVDAARSDLESMRAYKSHRAASPWRRARQNLAASWREVAAFGRDAFNRRAPIPFGDDG